MKHRITTPRAAVRALPGVVIASALLLAACGHDGGSQPATPDAPAGASVTAGSDAGTPIDPSIADPAPAPADGSASVPPTVRTGPGAPVVTASAGTAAPGMRVLSLSFATAGATGYRIDWRGTRSGTPFAAKLSDGPTGAADIRIPAWWDAADSLLVSACDAQACIPAAEPGSPIGTVPGPVDVVPPQGLAENAGDRVRLSADGLSMAVQGRNGASSTPLRLYTRASRAAAWTASAPLSRPTEDRSGFWGSWSMALSGDGSRLAVGDPNAGVSSNNGGFWIVLGPTGSTPARIFTEATTPTALGIMLSMSEDGSKLAVLAPSAVTDQILVYDLSGLTASSTALPTPTVVPSPVGMTVNARTSLRLSGDGRLLLLAGKSDVSQDAVRATVDLASAPTQVTAVPLASAPAGHDFVGSSLAISHDGSIVAAAPYFADVADIFNPSLQGTVLVPFVCTTTAPRSCTVGGTPLYTFTARMYAPDNPQQLLEIDSDGRAIVFGVPRIGSTSAGLANVYVRATAASDGWVLARTLAGSGNDEFGSAVAISRDLTIAVGAPGANSSAGSVAVY